MMKRGFTLFALLLSSVVSISGKQTVGVFLNDSTSFQGYTLFSPAYWYKTYLVNNDGRQVCSWESDYTPGLGGMAYLSREGDLYRSVYLGKHPVLSGGGATGGIQKFDWEGNRVWNFSYMGDNYCPHHDFEVLPSGNVLMVVWEIKTYYEAIQAGADKNKLGGRSLYPDHIIEVEPVGDDSGIIVWQWHAWDHLIQDFDPLVSNYGTVSDHPELIDINARSILISDFIHINSIKYNEEFDQILLTTPMYSEVWVIDHSTTTEEAKGHTGGKYGKGGDILYRWGNPANYDQGFPNDEKLFGGHDANWIDSGYPGAGSIIIFNNGSAQSGRAYSSVDEFTPPVDDDGNYTGSLPWGPANFVWTYTAPNPEDFFVNIICGAQRLPNGNTLICNAPVGEFFEVTPEGETVWSYIAPVTDSGPVWQGDSIYRNSVFKIRRYAPDFPGFEGRVLKPGKHVELYEDDTVPGIADVEFPGLVELSLSSNLSKNEADIRFQLGKSAAITLKVYNVLGQEVKTLVSEARSQGTHTVHWDCADNLGRKVGPGVYLVTLQSGGTTMTRRLVLVR